MAAARVERRLAAILAADVVGYSALMERDERDTFARLKAHREELFEPTIEMPRGRVFKLMGDGLLAEFGSVVDAVECAVLLQREMAARESGVDEDRRMRVRIGVNLGDVIVEGDDRHGEGVNIAARLEQLAEPGGIYASRTVYDHVRNKLALDLEPLGEHRVKNIAQPVTVYRVRLDTAPAAREAAVPRRWVPRRWWASAAAAVLLVVGGSAAWVVLRREPVRALPLPDKPSVAVLPFDNLTDDPGWDRLAGGITEDVITDLSMSRDLFVIARNSTAAYGGKAVDPRQVGHDLGVQYVLEGSFQSAGDLARVTAQLIDTSTGRHVWSDRFERPLADIFEVQKEVFNAVAARLSGWQGAIPAARRALAHRKPPESLQAFDYFLLGMEHQNRANKDDNIKAQELYRRATELDPQLARAYVGLAWTHCIEIDFGYSRDPAASAKECLRLASMAVDLDPSDADAHAAVAAAYTFLREWEKSEAEIEKGIALNPNNTDVLMIYAYIGAWFYGKPELAKERGEQALRLNPINYPAWYNQAIRTAYYFTREFDNALAAARRFNAPGSLDHVFLAAIYAEMGREGEARKAAADASGLDPDWSVERFLSGWGAFKRDAEQGLFIEGVRDAGLPVCASDDVLAKEPDLKRLPLCERERAKR
jgi:TolB-like protein/class 3 adenylate cyclase